MLTLRRLVVLVTLAILGSSLLTLPASAKSTAPAAANAILTYRHPHTGYCLDGSVSQGVTLRPCNGSNYQKWETVGVARKNVQNPSKCLDASTSQGVSIKDCNGGLYQRWGTSDNVDVIHLQSGYCLDASISQGVKIKPCVVSSPYQVWIY